MLLLLQPETNSSFYWSVLIVDPATGSAMAEVMILRRAVVDTIHIPSSDGKQIDEVQL